MAHSNGDSKFMVAFGKRLRASRVVEGMSQVKLASKLGMGKGGGASISRYENGLVMPSIVTLRRMCKTLDESADHLLEV